MKFLYSPIISMKERKGKQRKDDILNNPFIHKRIGVLYKE